MFESHIVQPLEIRRSLTQPLGLFAPTPKPWVGFLCSELS
jgi:hypothetical protein